MRNDIIIPHGTPLDGLVRIEDRGRLGARRDLVLHLAKYGAGKPEWNPLGTKGWPTKTGPDGLSWPVWRIPSDRLDRGALRTRAQNGDFSHAQMSTGQEVITFTEPSYGQDKNTVRTCSDTADFASAIIDSIRWSEANRNRAAEHGQRPVRKPLVMFDPALATSANQLRRGDEVWTGV